MSGSSFLAQSGTSTAPVPTPSPLRLEVPPEVVEKLTPPDPGLLTQPVATLLASFIALGAAYIAWRGVQRQVKANAENVDKQLKAQREQFEEAQSAQRAREVRSERLSAIQDIARSMARLTNSVVDLSNSRRHWLETGKRWKGPEWESTYREAVIELTTSFTVLQALGLRDAANTHFQYLWAANTYAKLTTQTVEAEAKAYESYLEKAAELTAMLEIVLDGSEHRLEAWRILNSEKAKEAEPV